MVAAKIPWMRPKIRLSFWMHNVVKNTYLYCKNTQSTLRHLKANSYS